MIIRNKFDYSKLSPVTLNILAFPSTSISEQYFEIGTILYMAHTLSACKLPGSYTCLGLDEASSQLWFECLTKRRKT